MLVIFPPIFVADTNLIYDYNFVTLLMPVKSSKVYNIKSVVILSMDGPNTDWDVLEKLKWHNDENKVR